MPETARQIVVTCGFYAVASFAGAWRWHSTPARSMPKRNGFGSPVSEDPENVQRAQYLVLPQECIYDAEHTPSRQAGFPRIEPSHEGSIDCLAELPTTRPREPHSPAARSHPSGKQLGFFLSMHNSEGRDLGTGRGRGQATLQAFLHCTRVCCGQPSQPACSNCSKQHRKIDSNKLATSCFNIFE